MLTKAVPFLVWGFFKLITPFIDPLTREKLKFNEDMSQYVPKEQLWTEFGGELGFDYDHSVYWPALMKMCEEKRAARKERWESGGKHIGELEDYLSGLASHGVQRPVVKENDRDGAETPDTEIDATELAQRLHSVKMADEKPAVIDGPPPPTSPDSNSGTAA